MPTAKAFAAVAPFPDDVPVFELPKFSLAKLISNDTKQSSEMFQAFREHGFALLNMADCSEGQSLLHEAERMFDVTKDVTVGLDVEEKMKYEASPKRMYG